jgi:hypothetical protein
VLLDINTVGVKDTLKVGPKEIIRFFGLNLMDQLACDLDAAGVELQ